MGREASCPISPVEHTTGRGRLGAVCCCAFGCVHAGTAVGGLNGILTKQESELPSERRACGLLLGTEPT